MVLEAWDFVHVLVPELLQCHSSHSAMVSDVTMSVSWHCFRWTKFFTIWCCLLNKLCIVSEKPNSPTMEASLAAKLCPWILSRAGINVMLGWVNAVPLICTGWCIQRAVCSPPNVPQVSEIKWPTRNWHFQEAAQIVCWQVVLKTKNHYIQHKSQVQERKEARAPQVSELQVWDTPMAKRREAELARRIQDMVERRELGVFLRWILCCSPV